MQPREWASRESPLLHCFTSQQNTLCNKDTQYSLPLMKQSLPGHPSTDLSIQPSIVFIGWKLVSMNSNCLLLKLKSFSLFQGAAFAKAMAFTQWERKGNPKQWSATCQGAFKIIHFADTETFIREHYWNAKVLHMKEFQTWRFHNTWTNTYMADG